MNAKLWKLEIAISTKTGDRILNAFDADTFNGIPDDVLHWMRERIDKTLESRRQVRWVASNHSEKFTPL